MKKTLCYGYNCMLKNECERYNPKPGKLISSMFVTTPWHHGQCAYFIDKKEGDSNGD